MKTIQKIAVFSAATMSFALHACSQQTAPAPAPAEAINPEPEWISNVPDDSDGKKFFIGQSSIRANRQSARNDARANARVQMVEEMGALVKSKLEEAKQSFGRSSEVIDPITATRQFQQQFSAGQVRGSKVQKYYDTQEEGSRGKKGWVSHVLVSVPVDSLNAAFQELSEQKYEQAMKDEQANAAEFWGNLKKQGFIE